MNLEEDKLLTIQLVYYCSLKEERESYFFLEMSTLQATNHFPPDLKLSKIDIFADTKDNEYLQDKDTDKLTSITNFNNFFLARTEFRIQNLEIEFENGMILSSHDDGEVTITLKKKSDQIEIIHKILNHYNFNVDLIEKMRKNAGRYLKINSQGAILETYEDFDKYVENEHN